MEHTLSVAQAVSAAANFFPGIDRDVAVTGALLHDIGKTEAYNDDPLAIDMTDAGRLQEIPLGYYKVRRQIEEIEGFDAEPAQAVLHIILSHHGQLEHGSPVVPCTREATLVHSMDNLGGKLGSLTGSRRSWATARVGRAGLRHRVSGLRRAPPSNEAFDLPSVATGRSQHAKCAFPCVRGGPGGGRLTILPSRGEGHREADQTALADLLPHGPREACLGASRSSGR